MRARGGQRAALQEPARTCPTLDEVDPLVEIDHLGELGVHLRSFSPSAARRWPHGEAKRSCAGLSTARWRQLESWTHGMASSTMLAVLGARQLAPAG